MTDKGVYAFNGVRPGIKHNLSGARPYNQGIPWSGKAAAKKRQATDKSTRRAQNKAKALIAMNFTNCTKMVRGIRAIRGEAFSVASVQNSLAKGLLLLAKDWIVSGTVHSAGFGARKLCWRFVPGYLRRVPGRVKKCAALGQG